MRSVGVELDVIRAEEGGRRLAALTSRLTADATTTQVQGAHAATGLSVSVEAGKVYEIKARGHWRTSLATAGCCYRLNGTATATRIFATYKVFVAAAVQVATARALATGIVQTAGGTINTDFSWEVDGLIVVNAAGTIILEHAAEVAATITTRSDSYLKLREIA